MFEIEKRIKNMQTYITSLNMTLHYFDYLTLAH